MGDGRLVLPQQRGRGEPRSAVAERDQDEQRGNGEDRRRPEKAPGARGEGLKLNSSILDRSSVVASS